MRVSYIETAEKLNKSRKRRSLWRSVVRCMATLVVFCTTYALILPAITLQSEEICGLVAHQHTPDCYQIVDEAETLICTQPEHSHNDACYPLKSEPAVEVIYLCGCTAHVHGEGCVGSKAECTIPEHMHSAECMVEKVDPTANLESDADWQQMADGLGLGENKKANVLTIAESQLGYRESADNVVLEQDTLNGYTRFGDWYGSAYGRWDAMFVSFCLHYAGVSTDIIGRESDAQRWMDSLALKELLSYQKMPDAGDVVFYRGDGDAVYAAISKAQEANANADGIQLRLIAGDVNNQVTETVISPDKLAAVLALDESGAVRAEEKLPTPPAEETPPAPAVLEHRAETENYIITVLCPEGFFLPENAEFRVSEYARDSEIFRQRCVEAGYELEWLLNIGFYIDEEELPLSNEFSITVTSKMGDALGQDITHFAETGTERINGSAEADNVSFTADSFSDFGGGVARAGETYAFETSNPSQLRENVDYILYARTDRGIVLFSTNLDAITVNWHGQGELPFQHNAGWSLSASQLDNRQQNDFLWQVLRRNGQTYLARKSDGLRLTLHNGWLQPTADGTALNIQPNGTGAYVGGQYQLRYDDQWRGTWFDSNGNQATWPTVVYFAALGGNGNAGNYPHAVHTGDMTISRLRFFNLVENGNSGISALAGCEFKITNGNGGEWLITSGSSPEVPLPADLPDGNYTIEEISAPAGYLRDTTPVRTFEVQNGMLVSDRNIGTFINHSVEQLNTDKSAEVADYNNRIYQVMLDAYSNIRMYQMDPIDVLFVVDQSNSMLFPAGLVSTGKTVSIGLNDWGNGDRLEALGLDKSKMHYIISDPAGTSTVWAVWHDGNAWMYQDASYYAKAKHSNEAGYQSDTETVIFPTAGRSYLDQSDSEPDGVRSNGGDFRYDLGSSGLGKYIAANGNSVSFTVYQSTDEYNRLHYLEESLANMIYELADVNSENRVTLTRFTKEVKTEDCFGPWKLTPENTERLVSAVRSIKTSGGTRQDVALKHIYEEHLNDWGEHFELGTDHTYTFLITDGAPVRSGNDAPQLGSPTDNPTTASTGTIYGQIKGYANQVKYKSQLMTVGLGMNDVEGGKSVLQQIASSDSFYCALDNARDLIEFMQKLIFESFRPKDKIPTTADFLDEISDSFYPIAWVPGGQGEGTGRTLLLSEGDRDYILLQPGDRIALDGSYSTDPAAPGLLSRRDDGTFLVTWKNQDITTPWNGKVYLKAKEDFIGGNAIDTNKHASISTHGITLDYAVPTVNVRLLDMNRLESEVTLYLGDLVNAEGNSPLYSLRWFFDNTRFEKFVSGGGDVLNAVATANGLEEAAFYLRYALGRDLTGEEWQRLATGDTLDFPYVYDEASSHGHVGCFRFRLEKSGKGSSFGVHESVSACQPGGHPLTEECNTPAEKYLLYMSYTAYKLGENGRPAINVNNGGGDPGREVGTGTTLPTGLGTVAKQDVHEVHVISGEIIITKVFSEGTQDENDRTFSFTLHRTEDGSDTSGDITKSITIPAGSSTGSASISFGNLRRGTYTVTEAEDEDYSLQSIRVSRRTNCYSVPAPGSGGTSLTCVMGNNTANNNVIGLAAESDRYTSYIDPVHGVLCEAEFTNAPIVHTAQLPVEKIWSDGNAEHSREAVYLLLCESGRPVMARENVHRLLRLDEENDWKSAFVITLADENDSLANYSYSVREVSRITRDSKLGWQEALVDGDSEPVYYEKIQQPGSLFSSNGKGYLVEYGESADGTQFVRNLRTADLPKTGGIGTQIYEFGGLLILSAALIYGCCLRRIRRKER